MFQKIQEEPKLDFTRNKLLQKIFNQYAATFALTLDTEDFIDNKHLKKFRKYVWKDMRKQLCVIPSLSRKIKVWKEMQTLAVKEKAESERSERIKSVSDLCSALDGQGCIIKLTGQARAYKDPCLLDCRLKLGFAIKLAGVCFALANTPAGYAVQG